MKTLKILANKVGNIVRSKNAKNAGWLIAGKIVQMILSLVVGVFTARYLGPSNYGLVNYGAAYTALFASICSLGINAVLVKEFVDNKEKSGEIIGTALLLRTISSILSIAMIFGIVSILDWNDKITILVVVLCSVGVLFSNLETFAYWFQSRLESKFAAIATLIGYIITSVYRIILMACGASVVFFALASAIDYLFVGLALVIFYITNKGNGLSFSLNYSKQLLLKSCHFILPGLMVAIYGQTDKMMLKQMINEAEVGYYSTAHSICNMWVFILAAIIDSFIPTIMRLHKEGNTELYLKRNKQLYCFVFYLSCTVSLAITLLAPFIVTLLYGEDYSPSSNPLRIITWYTAFSYLGVARNAWIVCENKQKYIIWIYLGSAISNVLLNVLLIPHFKAVGAAMASLIAQVLTILVIPLFIKPLRENTIMIAKSILFKFN